MESHDRGARPSGVSSFASGSDSTPRHAAANLMQHIPAGQTTSQYPTVSDDRYQIRSSISSSASAGRGSNMPSFPYPASPPYADLAAASGQPLQSTPLHYSQSAASDYGAQQEAAQRAQQQAAQQASPHTPQQTAHPNPQHHTPQQYQGLYGQHSSPAGPYDTGQQFHQRQQAALEVIPGQFAGVQQAYYVPGDGGPTSAPSAGIAPAGVQQPYSAYGSNQSPVARDAMAPTYAPSVPEASQGSGVAAQAAYNTQVGYAPESANIDAAFAQYEDAVRRTYELIRDCDLAQAGTTIASLSEWLLTNAENLGLTRDHEAAHRTRLKFWNDFNTCWIALLQRQKDLTRGIVTASQQAGSIQRLLQYAQMERLGKEVVRLCDSMEKHGLVDYQMGIWEEDIIALLTECLDLLEEHQKSVEGVINPSPEGR